MHKGTTYKFKVWTTDFIYGQVAYTYSNKFGQVKSYK